MIAPNRGPEHQLSEVHDAQVVSAMAAPAATRIAYIMQGGRVGICEPTGDYANYVREHHTTRPVQGIELELVLNEFVPRAWLGGIQARRILANRY